MSLIARITKGEISLETNMEMSQGISMEISSAEEY
jgi:hypothetical protein